MRRDGNNGKRHFADGGKNGNIPSFPSQREAFSVEGEGRTIVVGEIPYLNTLPIFTALKRHFPLEYAEFVQGHPAELNRSLREGLIDITPGSSIEFARHPEKYFIVPDISISSRIRVKSVLLFSPYPVEEEKRLEVLSTNRSATSVVLLKILLTAFLGKDLTIIPSDNPWEESRSRNFPALLIGDEAIRRFLENEKSPSQKVYDLGEMWHKHTGLPFVFALWIIPTHSWEEKKRPLKKFVRALLDAKKISEQMIRYRDSRMPSPENIPLSFLHDYWSNLSYNLGEELEGLRMFYRLARDVGEIPSLPELRFLPLP
ncbi:MAG: futalosine synthase [Deltaproteobacteria bacterium]|nr:MAG: futalosine synthase [Deltaproteobacteria bacterium]